MSLTSACNSSDSEADQPANPPAYAANKLFGIVPAQSCPFGEAEAAVRAAGQALAADERSIRVVIDLPLDAKDNVDMMGAASPIIAAIEVNAPADALGGFAQSLTSSMGACSIETHIVHERVLMRPERDWALGEPAPYGKAITVLQRKDGVSRARFNHEWTGPHAELALGWREDAGASEGYYVQNLVADGADNQAIDGIGEVDGPDAKVSGGFVARMRTAAHAFWFQNMSATRMFLALPHTIKD
ncbi:MAG: hypothetical protein P8J20_13680 [Novosphingobium sp.]|nr:hypothetical protein [Novosphingobium sp.]